jgi:hypothetical protein
MAATESPPRRVETASRIEISLRAAMSAAARRVRISLIEVSIMKKRFGVWSALFAAISFTAFVGQAHAVVLEYDSPLDGPSENPVNASPGTGFATATYDTVAKTLRVQASFSGLTGTTTLAHIHAPNLSQLPASDPPNPTFGVATPTPFFPGFPIGVTSGSYDMTFDLTQASSWNGAYITNNGGTTAGAESALALALSQGRAYFNIHTSTFGGGEIRGFLQLVPEPSTVALVGAGLGAIALRRRRK